MSSSMSHTHVVRIAGVAIAGILFAASIGCDHPSEPLPQPFPPNIEIAVEPALGSTVDAAAAGRVTIRFDQPMDPNSLRIVRRMSFLLPLSVADLQGLWNAEHTRVTFEMSRFPVQSGTQYEAVFSGLRLASGELYNMGPYRIHFRTRGVPNLLPVTLDSGLESRTFCHDLDPDTQDCASHSTLDVEPAGSGSAWYRWTPEEGEPTGELFRRRSRSIEWLGSDMGVGETRRSVLWSEPVPVCDLPAVRGSRWVATTRTAADGSRLENWQSVVASPESPAHTIVAGGWAVQLAFTDATVLEIRYDLIAPGAPVARHSERWWLYPGVGLVRREVRVERGETSVFERRRFTPGLSNDANSHCETLR